MGVVIISVWSYREDDAFDLRVINPYGYSVPDIFYFNFFLKIQPSQGLIFKNNVIYRSFKICIQLCISNALSRFRFQKALHEFFINTVSKIYLHWSYLYFWSYRNCIPLCLKYRNNCLWQHNFIKLKTHAVKNYVLL